MVAFVRVSPEIEILGAEYHPKLHCVLLPGLETYGQARDKGVREQNHHIVAGCGTKTTLWTSYSCPLAQGIRMSRHGFGKVQVVSVRHLVYRAGCRLVCLCHCPGQVPWPNLGPSGNSLPKDPALLPFRKLESWETSSAFGHDLY